MKKLITGAIVAAALAVPATPAFAIHDTTGIPAANCSLSPVGIGNASRGPHGNQTKPNTTFSNGILNAKNKWARTDTHPPCANA
jgi:hypothetical protein